MSSDLSCNTVKDLLPIYLDEIASEETNICVKKHLSKCQLCQNEYVKLCEITEKNKEVVTNEVTSIKILQKRIITWFIAVIIIGIVLVGIAMFCYNSKSLYNQSAIFKTAILSQYVGMYFLPLLGLFVVIIWKITIIEKEKAFWHNVIISFLAVWIVIGVIFLLWEFFLVIRLY